MLTIALASLTLLLPPQAQAGEATPASRHSYCTASIHNPQDNEVTVYYSQIFTLPTGAHRNAANDFNEAAFSEMLSQRTGFAPSSFEVFCHSRPSRDTVAEKMARDMALNREIQLPMVDLQFEPYSEKDAATPVALIPGSPEAPLFLNCTTTDRQTFYSLGDLFENSSTMLVKIAGPVVSVWRRASRQWVEHPCVRDSRDGQFCIVTTAALDLQASHDLSPGARDLSNLRIDLRSGAFRFENILSTPDIPPYMQSRTASGTCNTTSDPQQP